MGRRKKNAKTIHQSNKTETAAAAAKKTTAISETSNKNSPKLLNVYARLTLPLLELNDNTLLTDSDDEETLEFEFRPRSVFCWNMCLVCMDVSAPSTDPRRLIVCEGCQMVSYCSAKHRDDDRAKHEELCKLLAHHCGAYLNFAKDISPDLYRTLRIRMINLVEEAIKRRLELWEREILLYPRVCRTCRRIGEHLNCCPDCWIDFYCDEHRQDHAKWCNDFQVFRRILTMQHKHGYISPNFPDFSPTKFVTLAANFDALLLEMFTNNVNYRRIDAYTYASMSLSATAPLTALYAMQKTRGGGGDGADWQLKESLNIDIVGAEFQFECSSMRVWEKLFIHHLPRLKRLSLNFTGPELQLPAAAPAQLLAQVAMCRKCKLESREIRVTFNPGKLYHEVIGEKADLICLFNPGLYRETGYDGTDTWPLTIERFCDARVPVVVTSYTQVEIPRDIRRIQSIRKIEILVEPQINPFAAQRPDRNFVSDDIVPLMYKNYCLSVVKGV